MVAKHFPAGHPRAGEKPNFRAKILFGKNCYWGEDAGNIITIEQLRMSGGYPEKMTPKIHTIRSNYNLWAKRAEKINSGEAVLSLRQWTGKPYRSKQEEFLRLEKVGVQKVRVIRMTMHGHFSIHTIVEGKMVGIDVVAKNDGLSVNDFCNWFTNGVNGVVIHFTDFKY